MRLMAGRGRWMATYLLISMTPRFRQFLGIDSRQTTRLLIRESIHVQASDEAEYTIAVKQKDLNRKSVTPRMFIVRDAPH